MPVNLPVNYDIQPTSTTHLALMQVGDTVACLILPRSAVSFIPEEGHVMLIAGGLKIKLTENTLVDGSQGGTPQEMLTNLYSLL